MLDRCQNEQQHSSQNGGAPMTQAIEKIGAGRGNRTLVFSLEGCCSTIELHPRKSNLSSPAAHWRMAGSPAGAQGAKAGGRGRTRTYEVVRQRIYSPPPLPLGTLSQTVAPY